MISFVFMWVTTVIGRIKCFTLGDQNFQAWISKAHNMKAHDMTGLSTRLLHHDLT